MGMFDEVKVLYPLPDPEVQGHAFQTKDLDCMMDDYTITNEGRLIHHTYQTEEVPEEEREYYGTPEWNERPFVRLFGMIRRVPTGDVDTEYHGDIHLYTHTGDWNNDRASVVEYDYKARFTEGQLQWIKRVPSWTPVNDSD